MKLSKENTRRAYDYKQIKFLEYCLHQFSQEDNCDFITVEKVFGFMIYQCYRTKKDKGDYCVSGSRFRIDDYNQVIGRVNLGSQEVKKMLLNSTRSINTIVQSKTFC